MGGDSSGSDQLLEMQGTLRLSYPTLPDLGCLLTELLPTGCRATVMFQHLPPDTAAGWRKALQPQRSLRIKIESHPHLDTLEVDGLVVRVAETAQHCELELLFHRPTPGQAALLRQAAPAPPPNEIPPAPIRHPPVPVAGPFRAAPVPAPAAPPPAVPNGPGGNPPASRKRIGAVLVQMGKLSAQQVEEAVPRARASGEKLGQFLVRAGLLSPAALCRALALQSGLPMTDLTEVEIPAKVAKSFSYDLMARYEFVPFDDAGVFICIAAASPLHADVLGELERACRRKVEVFLAREDLVRKELSTIHSHHQVVPRKHIRYDTRLPVEYQFCTRLGAVADPARYHGLTLNISEGGFSVDGPAVNLGQPEDLLRVGMCVSAVVAPGSPHQLKALCRPKLIQPNGPRWTMGLEIIQATAEDRRHLKELCMQAMRAQAKPSPPQS